MFSLVYRSVAVENLELREIISINKKSIVFNKQHDITGCLLHHQGRFVQLLEGSNKSVLDLFEKIENDRHHHSVTVLHTEKPVIRIFNNWNMIFDDVNKDSVEKLRCFEQIYHSSYAVYVPNKSKLQLWREVDEILNEERLGKTFKPF